VIVTLKVRRFRGGESYVQEYRVDVRDLRTTVLDLLIKVKDNLDGSLAFRYACRMPTPSTARQPSAP